MVLHDLIDSKSLKNKSLGNSPAFAERAPQKLLFKPFFFQWSIFPGRGHLDKRRREGAGCWGTSQVLAPLAFKRDTGGLFSSPRYQRAVRPRKFFKGVDLARVADLKKKCWDPADFV